MAGFMIKALLAILTPLAGAYRVAAWKFRSFGGIGEGLLTWSGIVALYPVCVARWTPEGELDAAAFRRSWLALILWGWVQMFAKWCSARGPRDPGESHCWAGRWEPVLAAALAIAAQASVGAGAAVFVLASAAASGLQVALVQMGRRCAAWTSEDMRRLASPIRVGALSLAPVGVLLLAGVRRLWPKPAPAGDAPAAYRPPGFWGRVGSYLVGHMIFSIVTGALSLWGLFKYLTFILAIPLTLCGWVVEPPDSTKEEARQVMKRAKEAFDGEKEELIERLQPGKSGEHPESK